MSTNPETTKKSDRKQEKADKADKADKAEKAGKTDETVSKIAELTNDLKRVQADFENYKKRVERDNAKLCEYSRADLIKRLLTVLDSFEMALKQTGSHAEFVKGVELIYSQLYTLLKEEGLQHIEAQGKMLDPHLHEVMLFEKSDKDEDIILEELQKGYMFKDIVLRHSKVKVAKK
ncbi:nucleotide exchange factor GrpE [Candidatus Woesearchaeota archaeon]|nr:nucleotide exchange factor GrpE [Candidatus Woesearchaeota archaeon]